jgi:hypothetical protein
MKQHWDANLNVKELMQIYKPTLFVELGADVGHNTDQLVAFQKIQPFKLITISDGIMPERFANLPNYEWVYGISYINLKKFEDKSIDFCSIDTDHNYWTLKEELNILNSKMKTGGVVVMHDTEYFRYANWVYGFYFSGADYPLEEVVSAKNKSYTAAIEEALERKEYTLLKEVKESCGAMAVIKT